MPVDTQGLLRSELFTGLWLDPAALIQGDLATVLAIVQQGLDSPEHAAFVTRLRPQAATTQALSKISARQTSGIFRSPSAIRQGVLATLSKIGQVIGSRRSPPPLSPSGHDDTGPTG
jgi:hypothetical protein